MKSLLAIILFLLAFNSAFTQNSWVEVASNTNANLHDADADNNFVFATGDSGVILKSSDFGWTWSPIASPVNSTVYKVDMNDTNSVFIVSNGIQHTSNGGMSWTDPGQLDATDVSFDAQHGCYVNDNVIYESTNEGSSWIAMVVSPGSDDFYTAAEWLEETGYALGTIGSNNTMFGFRKGDGHPWRPMSGSEFISPVHLDSHYFLDDSHGFFFVSDAFGSPEYSLYKVHSFTYDSIFEWLVIWDFTADLVNAALPEAASSAVFLDDSTGLFTSLSGNIYGTVDGGFTWQLDHSGTVPLTKIIAAGDSSFVVFGNNGTILKRNMNSCAAAFSFQEIGSDVIFSADSNFLMQYYWDFGDGTTASMSTSAHVFPAPGHTMFALP